MFTTLYELLIRLGTFLQSFLLLALRLYWGYAFFQTGLGKFANHPQIVQFFQTLNIPYPELNAYLVAAFETVGGVCLFFGLGARLMCVPLLVILSTAYGTAHREALVNMFQDPDTFLSQAPFHFLMTTLIIFCFGPGVFSIDAVLKKLHDKKAKSQ